MGAAWIAFHLTPTPIIRTGCGGLNGTEDVPSKLKWCLTQRHFQLEGAAGGGLRSTLPAAFPRGCRLRVHTSPFHPLLTRGGFSIPHCCFPVWPHCSARSEELDPQPVGSETRLGSFPKRHRRG